MRWLVASDSHGERENLRQAVEKENALSPLDGLLYLGDGLYDLKVVKDLVPVMHSVRGNCDLFGASDEETVHLSGIPILLCHGHRWYVKSGTDRLVYRAQELGVRAALYGHTHKPGCEWAHGILLLNPGAMNMASYAVLTIGPDGGMQARHHKVIKDIP